MDTYLILSATVGILLAISSFGLAFDAAERQFNRRRCKREMDELRRQTRAAWERTMAQLERESAERHGRHAKRAFR